MRVRVILFCELAIEQRQGVFSDVDTQDGQWSLVVGQSWRNGAYWWEKGLHVHWFGWALWLSKDKLAKSGWRTLLCSCNTLMYVVCEHLFLIIESN